MTDIILFMPLLWLSLAFVMGILMGWYLVLPLWVWLILGGVSLVVAFVPLLQKRFHFSLPISIHFSPKLPKPPLPAAVLACAFFLGAVRMNLAQPAFAPTVLAVYNDRTRAVVIEGVVAAPPEIRDEKILLRIRAERLHPKGNPRFHVVEGNLLAYLPASSSWSYGDQIRLEGELRTPPEFENFSYKETLFRQGVTSYMSNPEAYRIGLDEGSLLKGWIWRLRYRLLDVINQIFPDPEASLVAGILLGIEGGIPEDLMEAFRVTGTAHIIAISGFNMAIIAGLFASLSGRFFGKRWGFLVAVFGIGFYTLLVGGGAGVVRAAIMSGMALFAVQVGRRSNGLNSLVFVAALMALWTPYVLWDVSFQLSFTATLGLVLFAEPFTIAFSNFASRFLPEKVVQRLAGPVGEYVLFTMAAMLMTLPLLVYYFGNLSLIMFIANPLVLPAQPLLMILSGLAALIGLAILPLGQVSAILAWPFSAYTIRVVEWLAEVPFASVAVGPVELGWVLVFYAVLFGTVFLRDRLPAITGLLKPGVVLLVLGALTVGAWRSALSATDERLHLTVLNVGTGDALLVQTPTGRRVLIDGGPSLNRLSDALGRRLPFGDRKLDWLVVAGTGEGQVGALAKGIARFPPDKILWSGPPLGSMSARTLLQKAGDQGIPIYQAEGGQSLDLGSGARLDVLAVTARGSVLLIEWDSFRVLIPIGLDFENMESTDLGPVTALLLAESGYAPLNPREWIEQLNPQVLLLSVAAGDANGLPDPETLEAVEGYSLLRTDQNGWVELSTDGKQMWVEVEK